MVFADATDNLLVIGRWINERSFNSALHPDLPDLPTTIATHQVVDFNLNSILPTNLQSFRYSGSLTTPPFTEGVTWDQPASTDGDGDFPDFRLIRASSGKAIHVRFSHSATGTY